MSQPHPFPENPKISSWDSAKEQNLRIFLGIFTPNVIKGADPSKLKYFSSTQKLPELFSPPPQVVSTSGKVGEGHFVHRECATFSS